MRNFLVVSLAVYSKARKTMPLDHIGDFVNAWHEGFDFKIEGGPYCSCRDTELMKQDGLDGVIIKQVLGGQVHTIQVKF